MPAYRFELAKASRVWRQGISTALIMDQSLHMLQDAGAVQVCTSSVNLFHGDQDIAVGVSMQT